MKKIVIRMAIVCVCIFMLCQDASALMNPAAMYCTSQGYRYVIRTTDAGQAGYCTLPDNQEVMAWEFLRGTAGKEYSYCARQGLAQKTITDPVKCAGVFSKSCSVCVQRDGREVEVTRLMNLSFREPNLRIVKPAGLAKAAPGMQPATIRTTLVPVAAERRDQGVLEQIASFFTKLLPGSGNGERT